MIKAGTVYDDIEAELVRRRLHRRDAMRLSGEIEAVARKIISSPPWVEWPIDDLVRAAAVLVSEIERRGE